MELVLDKRRPAGEHYGKTQAVRSGISKGKPGLAYQLYVPEHRAKNGRVLVSVHGISRNIEEHIELLAPYAEHYGVPLIAPLFDAQTFRDYQRLGRLGKGARADLALIRLLNELDRRLGWITTEFDLFGFSGGAQFAHRFALAHPTRVHRLALGAAGWYTMPDESLAYPYGTADAAGLEGIRLNVSAAIRIRTLVMVGEFDDRDDDELNGASVIRKTQGSNRLQRAHTWSKAMNALAREREIGTASVKFVELPKIDHSFRDAVLKGGLAANLFRHCCVTTHEAVSVAQQGHD